MEFAGSSGQTKLDIITRFTEKIFNKLIDGYIVNSKQSEKVLKEICRISQKKIFTIYNGLEKTSKIKELRKYKKNTCNSKPISPKRIY